MKLIEVPINILFMNYSMKNVEFTIVEDEFIPTINSKYYYIMSKK